MLVSKAAKLQDAATKAWATGVFVLYANKITWQPSNPADASAPKELHIGLISITNTQRAKGKPLLRIVVGATGHTFEFTSEADRDSAVDAYTKAKELLASGAPAPQAPAAAAAKGGAPATQPQPQAQAQQKAAAGGVRAPSPVPGRWAGILPSETQKRDMIREDPELAERYNSLVAAAGVLKEDEFWAGVMAEKAKAPTAAGAGVPAVGGRAGGLGSHSVEARPLPLPPGVPEQKRGLSNAMFQVPVEQDGRSVVMRFTLTPDLIALVFAEKPHVKRAYDKNVPHNMSEKEFWTRYLQHETAKEARRKKLLGSAAPTEGGTGGAGHGGSSLLDGPPPEHSALFEDGADAEGRRLRRKVAARADPTVDLAADAGESLVSSGESGLLHAANKEPVLRGGLRAVAEDLARDINRHATVVLAGLPALAKAGSNNSSQAAAGLSKGGASTSKGAAAGKKGGAAGGSGSPQGGPGVDGSSDKGGEEDTGRQAHTSCLEDLNAVPSTEYEELRIKDPRAYFDRLASTGDGQAQGMAGAGPGAGGSNGGAGSRGGSGGGAEQGGAFWAGTGVDEDEDEDLAGVGALHSMDPNNLTCPVMDCTLAYMVLLDVCGMSAGDTADAEPGAAPAGLAQTPDAVLAPALLTKFRTQVKTVADVSRHFWACIPANTPQKQEKVDRLAEHVDQRLWVEVDGAITAANRMGGPQRPYVRQLLTPALRMMEALLARHKKELADRAVRSASGLGSIAA